MRRLHAFLTLALAAATVVAWSAPARAQTSSFCYNLLTQSGRTFGTVPGTCVGCKRCVTCFQANNYPIPSHGVGGAPSGWPVTYGVFDTGATTPTVIPTTVIGAKIVTTEGTLQLDPAPLNPESIKLPYAQQVKVRFVTKTGGNSHTLGWFYLDQIAQFIGTDANGNSYLLDADGDGVKDFFQAKKTASPARSYEGLYSVSSSSATSPQLLTGATYSDGGLYDHISNLLEAGKVIFPNTEDDTDSKPDGTTNPLLVPLNDTTGTVDGIPDCDADGDGTAGAEGDRSINLGKLDGNREIVFYLNSYSGQASTTSTWKVAAQAVGFPPGKQTAEQTQLAPIMPFFSKSMLNPDSYSYTATSSQNTTMNNFLSTSDTSLAVKIDSGCASGGACGAGIIGWLDQTTIDRVKNTAAYGGLIMAPGVQRTLAPIAFSTLIGTVTTPYYYVPHVMLGTPQNDPGRWILGFEDAPIYSANSTGKCSACTLNSEVDYNDAVFIVEHENGGGATSNRTSYEITDAQEKLFTIDKVRIIAQGVFTNCFPNSTPKDSPPGGLTLGSTTSNRIDLYYSVDDGSTWWLVPFPPNYTDSTRGDALVDLSGYAALGPKLKWKVELKSNTDGCNPKLNELWIGFEAVKGQTFPYQVAEPVLLGNVLVRTSFGASFSDWTFGTGTGAGDRSFRGYITARTIYDDSGDAVVNRLPPNAWDLGAADPRAKVSPAFAAQGPDTRTVYFDGGSLSRGVFNDGNTGWTSLAKDLIPTAVRGATYKSALIYDFDGNSSVDDSDAAYVAHWTRGCETGNAGQSSCGAQANWRGGKMGGIEHSVPALLSPPGGTWWTRGAGTPGANTATPQDTAAYDAWAQLHNTRRTVILLGSQDGMIHAFDLGEFRWGGPHGYFLKNPTNPDYGTGEEKWAYIPRSQLPYLRNNVPQAGNTESILDPRASLDASITLGDVYVKGSLRTVAVTGMGGWHPYITALDVTDSLSPQPLWAQDWSDVDFEGTYWSPPIGPAKVGLAKPNDRTFVAIVPSGLTTVAVDQYLYLINLGTGQTLAKVQLNIGSSSAKGYGSVGSPVAVDTDSDGVVDRVYLTVTDVNGVGHLYKVNTSTLTNAGLNPQAVCELATISAPLYAPISVETIDASNVRVMFATGDHPERLDAASTVNYKLYIYRDVDPADVCKNPALVDCTVALPTNQRIRGAPVFTPDPASPNGGDIYFSTSFGDLDTVCSANLTDLAEVNRVSLTSCTGNTNVSYSNIAKQTTGAGGGVTGLVTYDGHLLYDNVKGTTTVIGEPTWNNPPVMGAVNISTPLWYEDSGGARCGN